MESKLANDGVQAPTGASGYSSEFRWEEHQAPHVEIDAEGFDTCQADVVIIGGGPTGLTLARRLIKHGVRVVLLERGETVSVESRAGTINRRSMEIFNRLDPQIAEDILSRAMFLQGNRTYFGERQIWEATVPPHSGRESAFPPFVLQWQWYLEKYLVDSIERVDASVIRWCSEVSAVEQDDDQVVTHVQSESGSYRIRSRWVVACDGGRSQVRAWLDQRMTGTVYEADYLIVDALVDAPQPPPTREALINPGYNPAGVMLQHQGPDGVWRLDYQLGPDEDLETIMTDSEVSRVIRAHVDLIGLPDATIKPLWVSSYKARALSLDSYQVGRIFFAGDAAHLLPIFGGFGMNSGVEDADNLGWRLALAIDAEPSSPLLAEYSRERISAIRAHASIILRSAEFLSPSSASSAKLREAAMSLAAEKTGGWAALARHRQSRPARYVLDGSSLPPVPAGKDDSDLVGAPFPDVAVSGSAHESRISSRFGEYFTILLTGSAQLDEAAQDEVAASEGRITVVRVETEATEGALRLGDFTDLAMSDDVIVVRPDGFVGAVLDATDTEQVRSTMRQLGEALRPALPVS